MKNSVNCMILLGILILGFFNLVNSNILHECRTKTGAGLAIAARVKKHDLNFDDPAGKCFVKCICEKTKWCDKDLKIQPDAIHQEKAHISLERLIEFTPECNEIKTKNDCDTAYQRFKCLFDQIPEIKDT